MGDGTTDTTRTVWVENNGNDNSEDPSDFIKEAYTRVLMCHINLAKLKFPKGTRGFAIDALARKELWDVGLDFMHGTGHGIGHYNNVHEGPRGIGITYKDHFISANFTYNADDIKAGHPESIYLKPNAILSNEPGYYQEDEFGIRVENAVRVTEKPIDDK